MTSVNKTTPPSPEPRSWFERYEWNGVVAHNAVPPMSRMEYEKFRSQLQREGGTIIHECLSPGQDPHPSVELAHKRKSFWVSRLGPGIVGIEVRVRRDGHRVILEALDWGASSVPAVSRISPDEERAILRPGAVSEDEILWPIFQPDIHEG